MEDSVQNPINPQESEGIPKFVIWMFVIMGIAIIILAANSVLASFSGKAVVATTTNIADSLTGSKLTLNVDIPCAGHASLIIYELKKLEGVNEVKFRGSGNFDVYYDPVKTSQQKILGTAIFKEYPASKI